MATAPTADAKHEGSPTSAGSEAARGSSSGLGVALGPAKPDPSLAAHAAPDEPTINSSWQALATDVGSSERLRAQPRGDRGGGPSRAGNPLWHALATTSQRPSTPRALGSSHDEAEEQADELASVLLGRVPRSSFHGPRKVDSSPALRRWAQPASMISGGPLPDGFASALERGRGRGEPLPSSFRGAAEANVGVDLGHVRVHRDGRAAELSSRASARAFAAGDDLYFGQGEYDHGSDEGRFVLAHEVAHTLLSRADAAPQLRRWQGDATQSYPPMVTLAFTLAGIRMHAPAEARFQTDRTATQQGIDMLTNAIAGQHATAELAAELDAYLRGQHGYAANYEIADADGNPRLIDTIHVDLPVSVAAIRWLWIRLRSNANEPASQTLGIPQDRLDLLVLGLEIDAMWRLLQRPEIRENLGVELPSWYQLHHFRFEMSHRGDQLRAYRQLRLAAGHGDNFILDQLAWYAYDSASIVEAYRGYAPLFADPIYRLLWNLPELEEGADPRSATGPSEDQAPNDGLALRFMTFAHSQPGPLERVLLREGGTPDPRQDLWDRFSRFLGRAAMSGEDVRDQVLSNGYSDRNAPPLPATLNAHPPLQPPYFDVAADTDYSFTMDVGFSDIYEAVANAFGGYAYIFEVIRVEADSLDNVEGAATSAPGSGEVAGWGQVWSARMRRQARYLAADYRTAGEALLPGYDADEDSTLEAIARLQTTLGPVGATVSTFVTLNAAIRTIGTVISTFFAMLTTPRHEHRVVFPSDGLYVVRAYCTPELDEDSEYRRATSVAWLPVWARSPSAMARLRAESDVTQALSQELALTAVLQRLDEKDQCDEEYEQLIQQRDALSVTLYGTADEVLAYQRTSLEARKASLEAPAEGSPEAELSPAERTAAIEHIDRAIASVDERRRIRRERNVDGRLDRGERITASFASDTGQVIRPLLEVTEVSASNGRFHYYLSELTNDNSGHADGYGSTRADAIADALENRFEQYSAYGRGELVAFIPTQRGGQSGEFRNIRIDADFTALTMEGIESITTIISVAALVAAPFTGGASLAILLPVGIIGAVPAAYRIADRADASTLRMDLQTAMDLVDVLGAFLSAGEVASGSLKLFRTSKFLGVLGFGTDGLGIVAVNWQTIEALNNLDPNLSPGERRLEIMRILGGALQANGMAVGGQLLSHSQRSSQAEPHSTRPDGEPDSSTRATSSDQSELGDLVDEAPVRRPPARPDPDFSSRLPADLRGRIPIEVDESLAATGSRTVHVTYEVDAWGLVTDIRIRRAPDATMADVDTHLSTVRRMQRFQGVSGWIRTLLSRLGASVGLGRHVEVGSMAWEAQLELRKLPEVINARMAELQAAVNEGRSADVDAIDADIAYLEQQARAHQRTLDELIDARGRGHVAAASGDPGDARAALRARRGTDTPHLQSIPDGWTGSMEARWRSYEPAPDGYYWRLREGDEGVTLFLQRTRSDQPALAYDHVNGEFVEFDARFPSERGPGMASSSMPSAVTTEAILQGYPPPPPGHHYVTVTEGVYRLRIDPDAAGHAELVPQILVRGDDGNFRFEARPEGNAPQIEFTPRAELQHGAASEVPADQTAASVDPREDWAALIQARDAAVRERERLAAGAPTRGTPEYEAWKATPAYREYTQAANRVAERSRILGEVAAEAYVRQNYPGAERVWPPANTQLSTDRSRVGDFDQVWRYMDSNGETHFVVVESKGGSAGPGSREVNGVRVEQGTRRYFDDTVAQMSRPGAPDDMRAVGQMLSEQGLPGVNIAYVMIQQPLTTQSSATVAGTTRAIEFDISSVEPLPQ